MRPSKNVKQPGASYCILQQKMLRIKVQTIHRPASVMRIPDTMVRNTRMAEILPAQR